MSESHDCFPCFLRSPGSICHGLFGKKQPGKSSGGATSRGSDSGCNRQFSSVKGEFKQLKQGSDDDGNENVQKQLQSFRFKDENSYEYQILLQVFSRLLKIQTPRKASF